jgi:hypothetical protein
MKYLKSFESLDSPQYEIIEYEQFISEFHKFINFSCMDKMIKLLKPFGIKWGYECETCFEDLSVFGGVFDFKGVEMDIFEMEDEWFIVRLNFESGDLLRKSLLH